MSNDNDCSPSPRQRNIHPPEIFQKADLVVSITSHSYKDNDVCFTTLEPIDARDFHIVEVGEAALQELDLAAVRCKYSNELLL